MALLVMAWDDVIEQGATFYRVVTLTQPADINLPYHPETNSVPVDLTNKTPRSTLMDQQGNNVANFACAKMDAANGVMAWSMPRGTTATLNPGKIYLHNIDLDDDIDTEITDRALKGQMSVNRGQIHS